MSIYNNLTKKDLKEIDEYVKDLQKHYANGSTDRSYKVLKYAVYQFIHKGNRNYLEALKLAERIPVDIETFMTHPDYMGTLVKKFWKGQIRDLKKMCPDTFMGEDPPTEVILTGASRIGKTFRNNVAMLYCLYFLCCFPDPHALFGLNRDKPIALFATGADKSSVEANVYTQVRNWFDRMPIIEMMGVIYNEDKESGLEIKDRNIILSVVPAQKKSLQGFDLIFLAAEETNAMDIIKSSKRALKGEGKDGVFDQAWVVMMEALNRREGSFPPKEQPSPTVGFVGVVSSVMHTNDYVSKRLKKIRETKPDHNYLILDQARWEVLPEEMYSKKRFPILAGCEQYSGKILDPKDIDSDKLPLGHKIIWVPENYKNQFKNDFDNAQKDIAGVASATIDAFIKMPERIKLCMDRYEAAGLQPYTDKINYDLSYDDMPRIVEHLLPKDRHKPRIIHLDQGITGDRFGISVVKLDGKVSKKVLDEYVEPQNHYTVELAISIQGSKAREVDIEDARNLAMSLRDKYGFNIIMITYDQFQSRESIQKLKKAGFRAKRFSSKNDPQCYEYFKKVGYAERVLIQPNTILMEEIVHLQKDNSTGKIDHAPGYSNDIIDAVVSAMYQFNTIRGYREGDEILDESGNKVQFKSTRPSGKTRRSGRNRR